MDLGWKPYYKKTGHEKLTGLIRAAIGLAYVPLDRIDEGFKVLEELAQELKGGQKKSSEKFLQYMKKTWRKTYPPKTWNYYMHSGANTNNHMEGYNSRLNNTRNLNVHPNPYLLARVLFNEIEISENKVISAAVKNLKGTKNTKNKALLERRRELMAGIHDRDTDLATYMKAIGNFLIFLTK